MEDIRKIVRNEEWQALRRSMAGTWKSQAQTNHNIKKLKHYLGDTVNENKLRRVHNYLAALRGSKYTGIKEMRNQVKAKRARLF